MQKQLMTILEEARKAAERSGFPGRLKKLRVKVLGKRES